MLIHFHLSPEAPQAGPGPAPQGRAGQGGPADAWYFVCLGISWYILDIFEYIWRYFWYIFGIFLDIFLDNGTLDWQDIDADID